MELDSFFVFAATKAQVYIKGLFKKLKITLRHKFFSARCAAFWNGLDDSTVSTGHYCRIQWMLAKLGYIGLYCRRLLLNFSCGCFETNSLILNHLKPLLCYVL